MRASVIELSYDGEDKGNMLSPGFDEMRAGAGLGAFGPEAGWGADGLVMHHSGVEFLR